MTQQNSNMSFIFHFSCMFGTMTLELTYMKEQGLILIEELTKR